MTGPEQVLIEDWCQQYPSHSIGALDFGPDGALYVTGGDGASFNFADWGQDGNPLNPCGDPPGGVGAMLSPPTAEGGALRSQDLRTPGDPTSLDGALLRVDPATGAGLPDNPNAASTDANARRIVAYGLRNPFRLGVRPGTGEVWIGDVGWNTWEEIQRIQLPTAAVGQLRLAVLRGRRPAERLRRGQPEHLREPLRPGHGGRAGAPLRLEPQRAGRARRNLSDRQLVRRRHRLRADERQQLPERVPWRAVLRRLLARLHLGDAPRRERRPRPGQNSHLRRGRRKPGAPPDRARRRPLLSRLRRRHHPPRHLHLGKPAAERGDHGEPDHRSRSADRQLRRHRLDRPGRSAAELHVGSQRRRNVRRCDRRRPPRIPTASRAPIPRLCGSPTTRARATRDSVTITVGNTPPTATIDTPAAGTTWTVGDVISFSGHATDPQQGTLPASALTWRLLQQHCPSNCHTHVVQTFAGVRAAHSRRPTTSTPPTSSSS